MSMRSSAGTAALLLAALALSGCGSLLGRGEPAAQKAQDKFSVYQHERFEADETYSRMFDATVQDTCEAARRALLSQGYELTLTSADKLKAVKRFQPEGELHVEIGFTVVCVPEGGANKLATAYVSAVQDRYVVKKSSTSTSVGVSAIGSISLPTSSTLDSLVKVGSETIPAGRFYDRFFGLMQSILKDQGEIAASAAQPASGTP
jgi:hypothetical protein